MFDQILFNEKPEGPFRLEIKKKLRHIRLYFIISFCTALFQSLFFETNIKLPSKPGLIQNC